MKKRFTKIFFKIFSTILCLVVFTQISSGQTGVDGLGTKPSVKKPVSTFNPTPQKPKSSRVGNNPLGSNPIKGKPVVAKAKGTQKYWNESYDCDLEDADCRIPIYTKILALDPNDEKALMYRGKFYFDKENYDAAIQDLTKALQLKTDTYAYLYRGQSYLRKANYDAAIQDFTDALRLKNAAFKEDNYYYRGLAYLNTRNYASAIEDYNEYVKLKPGNDGAYNNRGIAYGNLKNYEAAVRDFTKAIEINPKDALYYKNRAIVYRQLGKTALAQADADKLKELEGNPAKPAMPAPPVSSAAGSSGKSISGGLLNGKAINLVKPEYPAAARAVRATGTVNVQVTIDEEGKVIRAESVSGHPMLKSAAEKAAMSSTFNPTTLAGQKVKVTGIIVYSFGN